MKFRKYALLIGFLVALGIILAWLDNGPRKEEFEPIDVDSLPSRLDE